MTAQEIKRFLDRFLGMSGPHDDCEQAADRDGGGEGGGVSNWRGGVANSRDAVDSPSAAQAEAAGHVIRTSGSVYVSIHQYTSVGFWSP